MARYEAGETLASIAKTYDCSPPAISYIVSRSRAQRVNGSTAETAVEPHVAPEPQLIKAHPHDGTPNPSHAVPAFAAPSAPEPAVPPAGTPQVLGFPVVNGGAGPQGNGGSFQHRGYGRDAASSGFPGLPPAVSRAAPDSPVAMASVSNGEHREKLHLSLGNGSAHHHNGATTADQHDVAQERGVGLDRPGIGAQHASYPARHQEPHPQPVHDAPRYGQPQQGSAPNRPGNSATSGGYLDKELRSRVDSDIAAFLSAFDAALLEDSQENRSALREATDRLLRAGARTRIELERLEARTPLPPREVNRFEPAWRSR